MPHKTAILLSGGGRTLENLLAVRARGELPIDPVLVVSSSRKAFGLVRAGRAGIPAVTLLRGECADDASYCRAVFDACRAAGAELVLLAGWLKLLCPLPDDYRGKVLNIHPALLPSFGGAGFYGERVHAAALAAGVKVSGCTVHFVTDEYDRGPIVVQRTVPVLEGDDPATLGERVFAAECEAYPEAIRLYVEGRLRIEGRVVRVDR